MCVVWCVKVDRKGGGATYEFAIEVKALSVVGGIIIGSDGLRNVEVRNVQSGRHEVLSRLY